MPEQQNPVILLKTMHKEAATKLDYFILGATLAICAYLAQTNPYAPLGVNKETFLLGSLLVLATSAICGFKRIESTIAALWDNAAALEERDPQLRASLLKNLRANPTAQNWYRVRNYLLFAGVLCYLVAKVWATYQNSGWIPVH